MEKYENEKCREKNLNLIFIFIAPAIITTHNQLYTYTLYYTHTF